MKLCTFVKVEKLPDSGVSLQMNENDEVLVLDIGSSSSKVGVGGDDAPKEIYRTIMGQPKHSAFLPSLGLVGSAKGYFFGEDAISKRGLLQMIHPMEYGVVSKWELFEPFLEHIFQSVLRVEPAEHATLISEVPLNLRSSQEKMAELLFEKLSCSSINISSTALLSLLGSGRTTACVVECGDAVTHMVPIHEGNVLHDCVVRTTLAGQYLSDFMHRQLSDRGYEMVTSASRDVARDVKEKLCYVAMMDFNSEPAYEKAYELPDGSMIVIDRERYRCAEALFKPYLIGLAQYGIHDITYQAIQRCDSSLRRDFFHSVLLCGGSTMFPGLAERMHAELKNLAGSAHVIAAPDRKYSAWLGGSVLASLSTFRAEMCVSRREYDENGYDALLRRCRWPATVT